MKSSGIGGQAVIEGIMMKNRDTYAVAVRKSDGDIVVETAEYKSVAAGKKFCSLPFVRGIFGFVDSLVLGMKTLTFSAGFFEEEEETSKEKGPGFLERLFGERLEGVITAVIMVFSMVMAISLFMLLPLFAASFFRPYVGRGMLSLLEGVIRIGLFILYVVLVSRMNDIKRTFMYHGAEHKCINCIEHGLDLTPENVAASSKQHKRCGTSFLFFVMFISVIFFFFIRVDGVWLRMLSRILLIPVIAGISYEVIRLAGSSDSFFINLLSKPGMWLQNLTTKEPDLSMIEVAICAVEEVYDWRTYQKENFPKEAQAREAREMRNPVPGIS